METKASNLKGSGESAPKKEETKAPAKPAASSDANLEAPDPDEDDLDDLDGKFEFGDELTLAGIDYVIDMLDEFSAPKVESKAAAPVGSRAANPAMANNDDLPPFPEDMNEEDFEKQLQAGMAELLGGLETNPDMQAQFEEMMKELSGAAALGQAAEAAGPPPPPTSAPKSVPKVSTPKASSSKSAAPAGEDFQETIRKTMERMQASGDQATAAAAADDTDDILAQMLKQMTEGGLDGEGSEEDFSKMLLGMMEQLTNKEILYEPMKELDDKYPSWMEANKEKVKSDDMERYKEQQTVVSEIVKKFEEKTYSDENVKDREYIVERMQKVRLSILLARGSTDEL